MANIPGSPIDTSKPLYTSSGYEHQLVSATRSEIVTKSHGAFAIWDAKTGECLKVNCEDVKLSNTPPDPAELARLREQSGQLFEQLHQQSEPTAERRLMSESDHLMLDITLNAAAKCLDGLYREMPSTTSNENPNKDWNIVKIITVASQPASNDGDAFRIKVEALRAAMDWLNKIYRGSPSRVDYQMPAGWGMTHLRDLAQDFQAPIRAFQFAGIVHRREEEVLNTALRAAVQCLKGVSERMPQEFDIVSRGDAEWPLARIDAVSQDGSVPMKMVALHIATGWLKSFGSDWISSAGLSCVTDHMPEGWSLHRIVQVEQGIASGASLNYHDAYEDERGNAAKPMPERPR